MILTQLHREIGKLTILEIEGLLAFAREYRNPPRDQTPQWLLDLEQPSIEAKRLIDLIEF